MRSSKVGCKLLFITNGTTKSTIDCWHNTIQKHKNCKTYSNSGTQEGITFHKGRANLGFIYTGSASK